MPVLNVKSWREGFEAMIPLFIVLILFVVFSLDRVRAVDQERLECGKQMVLLVEQQAQTFQNMERLCEGDGKQLVIKNVLLKGANWDYDVGCK